MHRLLFAALALVLLPGFVCANQKPDAVGGGDERLDDQKSGGNAPADSAAEGCGPDGKGDVVLIDARTAGALPCVSVTLSRDSDGEVVFQGHANKQGQVRLTKT